MTLTSTRYGFLTPQTLYKPLPPPLKYPYPWKGYGFALGKGKGRCENTCGLPVPITTEMQSWHFVAAALLLVEHFDWPEWVEGLRDGRL